MATERRTVQTRTRVSIDQLISETVNGGSIVDGKLILTSRGGAQIIAGTVTRPWGEVWSSGTAYKVGDVVGYGGGIYKARSDNQAMCPPLFSTVWTCLIPPTIDGWYETDPYMEGNTLDPWEFFWANGGPSVAFTQTAGRFETGSKAMQISLPASASQRFYQRAESTVRGGEVVQVLIRAKLLAAAPGARLYAELYAGEYNSEPAPFAPSTTIVGATEGAKALTTDWATYRFTMPAPNNRQRARVHINPTTDSTGAATVLIDHYAIRKHRSILKTPTDWVVFPFATGYIDYGGSQGSWDRCRLRRNEDGMVKIEGLAQATDGNRALIGIIPPNFRPGGLGKHVPAAVNGTAGYINIFPDGRVVLNTPSAGSMPANGFVSLEVPSWLAEL